MAVFFNGQLLVTPGTASAVNDDAMQNQNLTVGNVVAYVGKSTGGEPGAVLSFGNPEEAKAVLRGGELLTAVLKAFDPSAETGAPSTVRALRVNPAVQAALALKNASDETVITLKSANYGLLDNQIKAKVEGGSLSGKRVTVQSGRDYFTSDNLGRAAFSVQYTGAEADATVDVTASTVVLSAPAGTAVATIDLAEFATVDALVDKINSLGGFTATALDNSDQKPTLNALDFVAAQDIKTAAFTVRADLQAIVDWFNRSGQPLVVAERTVGAGTVPANIPFTFLAGGSEGVTTITHWADAFDKLQTVDVQWVGAISGEPAIIAMADTHAHFCSNTLRRERRASCGTAAGTSKADAKDAAKLLNSDRTSLAFQGYYDYDSSGKLVLQPPYMSAAVVAAAFAGVNPGTPLTNKSLKFRGLEFDLRNPTDTDEMIQAGLLCFEDTEQGYKVVQSISTWRGNDKYNRVEQSTGVALDFTVRNVRQAVDILRGQKGNPLILSRAVSITESTLRELARAEPEGPGVLAGDAENPAYRNIRATIEGDVVRIQFECSPVIPANYILVTVYARPFSGTATA